MKLVLFPDNQEHYLARSAISNIWGQGCSLRVKVFLVSISQDPLEKFLLPVAGKGDKYSKAEEPLHYVTINVKKLL